MPPSNSSKKVARAALNGAGDPEVAPSESESIPVALCQTQHDMIHAAGSVCQAIGLAKTLGQVFAYLYMSTTPQTLDEIAAALQISKASASNSVRQIASWGAARAVYVPGARREHYEVIGDLTNLISGFINDFLKPRFSVADKKIEQISIVLEAEKNAGHITAAEFDHYSKRIKQINKLHKNIRKLTPLAQKLL